MSHQNIWFSSKFASIFWVFVASNPFQHICIYCVCQEICEVICSTKGPYCPVSLYYFPSIFEASLIDPPPLVKHLLLSMSSIWKQQAMLHNAHFDYAAGAQMGLVCSSEAPLSCHFKPSQKYCSSTVTSTELKKLSFQIWSILGFHPGLSHSAWKKQGLNKPSQKVFWTHAMLVSIQISVDGVLQGHFSFPPGFSILGGFLATNLKVASNSLLCDF